MNYIIQGTLQFTRANINTFIFHKFYLGCIVIKWCIIQGRKFRLISI